MDGPNVVYHPVRLYCTRSKQARLRYAERVREPIIDLALFKTSKTKISRYFRFAHLQILFKTSKTKICYPPCTLKAWASRSKQARLRLMVAILLGISPICSKQARLRSNLAPSQTAKARWRFKTSKTKIYCPPFILIIQASSKQARLRCIPAVSWLTALNLFKTSKTKMIGLLLGSLLGFSVSRSKQARLSSYRSNIELGAIHVY